MNKFNLKHLNRQLVLVVCSKVGARKSSSTLRVLLYRSDILKCNLSNVSFHVRRPQRSPTSNKIIY